MNLEMCGGYKTVQDILKICIKDIALEAQDFVHIFIFLLDFSILLIFLMSPLSFKLFYLTIFTIKWRFVGFLDMMNQNLAHYILWVQNTHCFSVLLGCNHFEINECKTPVSLSRLWNLFCHMRASSHLQVTMSRWKELHYAL